MTIRNLDAYIGQLWDWGILDGCFGDTRIKPTDIDGFVERNGYFLVLEGKGSGVTLPKGQEIMYKRLLETGRFTIIIVWGKPGDPERFRVLAANSDTAFESGHLPELRSVVAKWFAWANQQNRGIA